MVGYHTAGHINICTYEISVKIVFRSQGSWDLLWPHGRHFILSLKLIQIKCLHGLKHYFSTAAHLMLLYSLS